MNRRLVLLGGALCASAVVTASGASAMFGSFPEYEKQKWRSKEDYDRDRESYVRECCEGRKPMSKGHGRGDDECDEYDKHKKYGGGWWW